jgi:hypothetical protein
MEKTMTECVGLMIAKRESTRLPGKNTLDFMGAPLFEWNLNKILSTGIKVYFDSDSEELLLQSEKLGAIPHLRPDHLLGHDIPSIPIFQQLYDDFSINSASLLNIQANSPNVSIGLIDKAIYILKNLHCDELLTIYPSLKINGSLWGFSSDRLLNYGDPYVHNPDVLLTDESIDVHTIEEYNIAHSIENSRDLSQSNN